MVLAFSIRTNELRSTLTKLWIFFSVCLIFLFFSSSSSVLFRELSLAFSPVFTCCTIRYAFRICKSGKMVPEEVADEAYPGPNKIRDSAAEVVIFCHARFLCFCAKYEELSISVNLRVRFTKTRDTSSG